MPASNAELPRHLHDLEAECDEQFKVVFDAIRQLMLPRDADPIIVGLV
jgi:hypothetical protein